MRRRTFIGCVVGLGVGLRAEEDGATLEDRVKAACVYHFTQFVTWPEDVFLGENAALVVGVLGSGGMASALAETLKDKRAMKRPIELRVLRDDDVGVGCQVLVVPGGERVEAVAAAVQAGRVLTVGEGDRFLEAGGVVRLLLVGTRVQFDVNLPAAEKAQLRISPQMLKLARKVYGGKGPGPN
jgi:hypothetical protein